MGAAATRLMRARTLPANSMHYLKFIGHSVNHESGQDTATASFRIVDDTGKPVEKMAPVGIALPRSVVDLTALKPNAMFALSFSEVMPRTVAPATTVADL